MYNCRNVLTEDRCLADTGAQCAFSKAAVRPCASSIISTLSFSFSDMPDLAPELTIPAWLTNATWNEYQIPNKAKVIRFFVVRCGPFDGVGPLLLALARTQEIQNCMFRDTKFTKQAGIISQHSSLLRKLSRIYGKRAYTLLMTISILQSGSFQNIKISYNLSIIQCCSTSIIWTSLQFFATFDQVLHIHDVSQDSLLQPRDVGLIVKGTASAGFCLCLL